MRWKPSEYRKTIGRERLIGFPVIEGNESATTMRSFSGLYCHDNHALRQGTNIARTI
jgi:hypothetical protein